MQLSLLCCRMPFPYIFKTLLKNHPTNSNSVQLLQLLQLLVLAHRPCRWWGLRHLPLLLGLFLLLQSSTSTSLGQQLSVSFLDKLSNRITIAECDLVNSSPIRCHCPGQRCEVSYCKMQKLESQFPWSMMISMMKKVHNLKLTLTAICRHMLSFGILSRHKPVRWQNQITISGWKIREAKQLISKVVNGGRRRRLDSRCVLCTKLLDDSCSFQDEEDVVHIVRPPS